MGYLPLGIVLLSDWSVCARCGLVAPSRQYTATSGGMDPAPLSELMNNCKLECEQGWWKVQSATRSVHIERSSWGSKSHQLRQPKKRKNSITRMGNWVSLVAEMGFEPHDLRVMSPTSCQTAPLRAIWCRKPGSNRYEKWISRDFKSRASAYSAIPAFYNRLSSNCLTIISPYFVNVKSFLVFLLIFEVYN